MEYLIGIIGLLLGGFIFQRTKRKSAESLLNNLPVKEEAAKHEASVTKNEALGDAEKQKRADIESETKAKQDESTNLQDLERFFNRKP